MNPRTQKVVEDELIRVEREIIRLEAVMRTHHQKLEQASRDMREAKYQRYALEESLKRGANE